MDWLLAVTTLLANGGLGWTKGRPWMWLVHAFNAVFWIIYSVHIHQYGLVLLSVATVILDLWSGWRAKGW